MRILKISGKIFLGLIGTLLFIQLLFYAWAPVYDFPESLPFHGDSIFNPYRNLDSSSWRKANFHYHARAWLGLTDGSGNSYEEFTRIYGMLGYDAPQISNYQHIDRHFQDSSWYIPTYEHGFGIRKKHQILIGARQVLWFDLAFFQTLSHKQFVLDLLRKQNDIVAIAHPDWDQGYSSGDLQYLTNYDLIEALNNNWRSVPQWDAALSSGHAAFILADDDAHDIRNVYEVGLCCTYIHAPGKSPAEMIRALKTGQAYGADIDINYNDTYDIKAREASRLPLLKQVRISHDTLFVEVTGKALSIAFIGQHGQIRKIAGDTHRAWYVIGPEDTYIRTTIRFYNYKGERGTMLYLNPVFRTTGGGIPPPRLATVNTTKTWLQRILSFTVIFLIIGVVLIRKK